MALASIWTDHLPNKQDKIEFEKSLRHQTILLQRLIEIIDLKIKELDRKELGEDYSSPVWPMLQADRIGQYKQLNYIRKLLDLKDMKQ